MLDANRRFHTALEHQAWALSVAEYMRNHDYCLCMSCVARVCERQRLLMADVMEVLHKITGVPCLAREHDILRSVPAPSHLHTPHY